MKVNQKLILLSLFIILFKIEKFDKLIGLELKKRKTKNKEK